MELSNADKLRELLNVKDIGGSGGGTRSTLKLSRAQVSYKSFSLKQTEITTF